MVISIYIKIIKPYKYNLSLFVQPQVAGDLRGYLPQLFELLFQLDPRLFLVVQFLLETVDVSFIADLGQHIHFS